MSTAPKIASEELNRESRWRSGLLKDYSSSWVVRTVSELIQLTEKDISSAQMADFIGVPESEVLQALNILVDLGIIKYENQRFERIVKYISFSDSYLDPSELVSNHKSITKQVLQRLNPEDKERGQYYRTAFLATNRDVARKYLNKLESIIKEFMIESQKSKKDTVFAFSLTGVEAVNKKKSPKD